MAPHRDYLEASDLICSRTAGPRLSQWNLVEQMLYAPAMSFESETYRKRAQEQREEAERTTLPNAKARVLHAAERWDVMAEQAERASAATIRRDADKAVRDAERAGLD